jgi:hypothetical protein
MSRTKAVWQKNLWQKNVPGKQTELPIFLPSIFLPTEVDQDWFLASAGAGVLSAQGLTTVKVHLARQKDLVASRRLAVYPAAGGIQPALGWPPSEPPASLPASRPSPAIRALSRSLVRRFQPNFP